MTGLLVGSIAEWHEFVQEYDEPAADAVGELADAVRARFGVNKHVPVLFRVMEPDSSPHCSCCDNEPDDAVWVIEAGDCQARLPLDWGGALEDMRWAFASWLDEPRRNAEATAKRLADEAWARACEKQTTDRVFAVMQEVEGEGHRSDRDWHDSLMRKLGVHGYRDDNQS